jgi:hypothetical protein
MSMLNISKYQQAIFGCSAIAAASFAGFGQSASAAEQLSNRPVRTDRSTILIAGDYNGSTAGGTSTGYNGSTAGGYNGSTNGGNGSTNSGPREGRGGPRGFGYSQSTIARAGALNSTISLKQSAYNTAAQNLASLEAATPQASDTTPVRFARQALDAASCGCPNADTNAAATPTPRPELVAARAAEAQAAAELAAAKAEARQFLESVKNENTASGSVVSSPIW